MHLHHQMDLVRLEVAQRIVDAEQRALARKVRREKREARREQRRASREGDEFVLVS